ncbi:MAG: glycosyltransferase family 39 protein [Acidimicrobiales bacterium]
MTDRAELATTLTELRAADSGPATSLIPVALAPAPWWRRRLRGEVLAGDAAALAGLILALAFLWGRGRSTWYWMDEAISVGIASRPLGSIPELLRMDGSPPLYYLLLHGWTSLFGSSEAATHTLSLIFSLAAVPAALWAGWSLFGRRTGWVFAALVALSPFLAYYSNETRMYSLVVLLALLTTATFLHAFVFGHRRFLPAFAVLLTLVLYTHNWGIFLAVGTGAAALACAVLGHDRRRTLTDAALAFGGAGLLYLPWLPTLVYQRASNPNPWAQRATLLVVREDVADLVGGREVVVALGVGSAAVLFGILRHRSGRQAVAVISLLVIPVVVLAGGYATGVWGYRYLAIVVPPILLVLAVGLARGGSLAVAALAVTALLTAPIGVKVPLEQKSNAKAVAEEVAGDLQPDDLVISTDYAEVPELAYYLPPGLRYAGADGLVAADYVTDWRNGLERMRNSQPSVALPPLIDAVPPGGHVLMMCPRIDLTADVVEYKQLANDRCDEIKAMLLQDDQLDVVTEVPPSSGSYIIPFEGLLLVKGGG